MVKALGTPTGITLPGGFAVASNFIHVVGVSGSPLVDLDTNTTLTSLTTGGFVARFATNGTSPLALGLAAAPPAIPSRPLQFAPAVRTFSSRESTIGIARLQRRHADGRGRHRRLRARTHVGISQPTFAASFGGTDEDDANDSRDRGRRHDVDRRPNLLAHLHVRRTQIPASAGGGFQGFVGKVPVQKTTTAVAYPSSTGTVSVDAIQTDEARKYVVSAGTYKGAATFPAPAGPVSATSAQDQAGFIIRRPY